MAEVGVAVEHILKNSWFSHKNTINVFYNRVDSDFVFVLKKSVIGLKGSFLNWEPNIKW